MTVTMATDSLASSEKTTRKRTIKAAKPKKVLTLAEIGWTKKKAVEVRAQFASFAEDWDDPSMEIYDAYV